MSAAPADSERLPARKSRRHRPIRENIMTNTHPSLPAWADQLRPGDILAFRFPHGEADQGTKIRPCVVLAVQRLANSVHVTLAFGTTATGPANRGLDLSLCDKTDWQTAGLHRPTRFVLARRLTVSSIDLRFDLGAPNDPMIGRVPDHALNRLAQLIAFLGQAITDDRHRGRTPRRRMVGRRGRYRSAFAQCHEITVAGAAPRARGQSCDTASTVIIEHRSRRVSRSTASAG